MRPGKRHASAGEPAKTRRAHTPNFVQGCILVYMSDVLSLRLPSDLKVRLDALSASTKRPASIYVREALENYLEDLEDYYEAVETYQRVSRGAEKTYNLAEVGEVLGLGD